VFQRLIVRGRRTRQAFALAAVHVAGDQDRLKELMRELVSAGEAPNLLEGLTRTKKHLEALEKLIDVALVRSFLVLERLGY
jgi:hypothetical protein